MKWSIDGVEWEVPCTINRAAEVKASEISGLMLDRSYFNDVIGTYMRYTVAMAVPFGMLGDYAELYEMLTSPVDGHTFIFPYNGETVTMTGRVDVVSDVYVSMPNDGNHWRKTTFTITANYPTKYKTLDQIITAGRSPYPDTATAEVGSVYTYTANGWVKTTYKDADNEEY